MTPERDAARPSPDAAAVALLEKALEDAMCDCAGPFPEFGLRHEPRCFAVGNEHQPSDRQLAERLAASPDLASRLAAHSPEPLTVERLQHAHRTAGTGFWMTDEQAGRIIDTLNGGSTPAHPDAAPIPYDPDHPRWKAVPAYPDEWTTDALAAHPDSGQTATPWKDALHTLFMAVLGSYSGNPANWRGLNPALNAAADLLGIDAFDGKTHPAHPDSGAEPLTRERLMVYIRDHWNATAGELADGILATMKADSGAEVAALIEAATEYLRALDGTRSMPDPNEQAGWGAGVEQWERTLRALLADPPPGVTVRPDVERRIMEVEWNDSVIREEGWHDDARMLPGPDLMRHLTVGYIANDGPDHVTICSSRYVPETRWTACVTIPRAAIVASRLLL